MKRNRSTSPVKPNRKRQKSTPPVELNSSSCSYCDGMLDGWHVHLPRFHEECNKCSSPDTTMPGFCSLWKHLRLEHLYKCCKFRTQMFEFGNVQLCQKGGHCPGCRAVRMSIGHCGSQEPPTGGDIELWFDFDHRSALSNQWARLCTSHKESGRGSWMTIFRDYRRCSVSEEVILREHYLNDSDWMRLRTEIGTTGQPNVHGISGLKVIDVQERRIVKAPPACEYVALSYVWGTSEAARNSLKTTSFNINILEALHGLDTQHVPATVKDAMTACEKLGKRYLWIDRLCILQDGDNSAMVNVMDQIYSLAVFTIVAPANDEVLQGLRGISRSQIRHFEHKSPGWRFLQDKHSGNQNGNGSKWKSRAWTFQEERLSKIIVFFGEHHVSVSKRTGLEKDFFNITPDYSRRDLSYTGDKVRAFVGVLNSLYNRDHRYGIPFHQFEAALLWTPEDPSKNQEFPSWSWASVRSINYDWYHWKHLGMSIASWAFYTKTTADEIQLTPVTSKPKAVEEDWREKCGDRVDDHGCRGRLLHTSLFVAWKEGCFEPPMPHYLEGNGTWKDISRRVQSLGSYEHCWNITRPQNLYRQFTEAASRAGGGDSDRLLVCTQFATFGLEISKKNCEEPVPFRLITGDNILTGWAVLDRPVNGDGDLFMMDNAKMQVEVLALSIVQATFEDADAYLDLSGISRGEKDVHGDIRHFDSSGEIIDRYRHRPPLVLLNVMLVRRLGESYHRIGLGKVLLKRWKNTGPQFKVFILE